MHYLIYLALFLSSGKMFEDIKSINSSIHVGELAIDCCNERIGSRVERSSIVTLKSVGDSPEAIFASLSTASF